MTGIEFLKALEECDYAKNDCNNVPWLARFAEKIADIEREACAKLCDDQISEGECPERAAYCAEAIRARNSPTNGS